MSSININYNCYCYYYYYNYCLYLFTSDQSDDDLCHCMANLVGVVLGCQPQSNHLWYHMFAPDELKDTYMTGFMVNKLYWFSIPVFI